MRNCSHFDVEQVSAILLQRNQNKRKKKKLNVEIENITVAFRAKVSILFHMTRNIFFKCSFEHLFFLLLHVMGCGENCGLGKARN